MFPVGARVYVHASSISSKKIGPKRHSVGYVSNIEPTYIASNIKNFPIPEQGFLVTPYRIVFTRFGREKRRRIETKNFLNVVPISFVTGECTEDNINKVLSLFTAGELRNNDNWLSIVQDYQVEIVGTLLPVGHGNNIEMTDQGEAIAFITAMLRNHVFNGLLNNNRRLPTLINLAKGTDMLHWLGNAAKQTKTRTSLFEWAKEQPSHLTELLYIVQMVKILFHKRAEESMFKSMELMVKQGRTVNLNRFISWYTDGIFDSKLLTEKKAEIVNSKSFGPAAKAFINNVNTVRDTYLDQAHKLKYI